MDWTEAGSGGREVARYVISGTLVVRVQDAVMLISVTRAGAGAV